MNNIYTNLRSLAKSVRAQNFFAAVKEINGLYLFHNKFDFSKIQEIYLSYLYNYDSINKDIILEKISKHVLDSEIYEDSYLLWKRKNINKKQDEKDNNKKREVKLVMGKDIKFPEKV